MKAPKTKRARRRKILLALLVLALSPVVLFVLNGTVFSDGETPLVVTTDVPAVRVAASEPREVKALAWNIAKAFAYRGGVDFEDASVVRERIEGMAKVIREENPDFVFLSEAVRECTPCPVNQVELLAELCGMHAWAFGENYCFGLPLYRIVGGNAILSRFPLRGFRCAVSVTRCRQ